MDQSLHGRLNNRSPPIPIRMVSSEVRRRRGFQPSATSPCSWLFDRHELRGEHHVVRRNFFQQSHLDERLLQHRHRLGIEGSVQAEIADLFVIGARGHRRRNVDHLGGDLDGLVLVGLHEGDGVHPAAQKRTHNLGALLDHLLAREKDVGDEIIDERRRAGDDAPFLLLLERIAALERTDVAVELTGLDRGAGRRHAADRDRGDAGSTPALEVGDPLADPVGQRADGGDAELQALEIVHRLGRRVVTDHHRHVLRHAVHHGHRLGRDAFDHEGHAGAAADADVGAVGGQGLLQLGVAGRGRSLDLQPVLGEDAGLDADVERREGPGERHRLDDADLFRRAGRHRDQHGQTTDHGTEQSSHGILLDGAPPRRLAGIITENGNLCHASWARRVDPEQPPL